jgi:hypothetical protein
LEQIPEADLTLAFNIFPYIPDADRFLEILYSLNQANRIVVRQYDGGTMRIGPMPVDDRAAMDSSLQASLNSSSEFSHYDLDRTYSAIRNSSYTLEDVDLEVTQRIAPFPQEFVDYFDGTVAWISEHLSEEARRGLSRIVSKDRTRLYFAELDLTAVLRCA